MNAYAVHDAESRVLCVWYDTRDDGDQTLRDCLAALAAEMPDATGYVHVPGDCRTDDLLEIDEDGVAVVADHAKASCHECRGTGIGPGLCRGCGGTGERTRRR